MKIMERCNFISYIVPMHINTNELVCTIVYQVLRVLEWLPFLLEKSQLLPNISTVKEQ